MKAHTTAGFYGKLPIVGDFVSRRLPNDFIESWDSWLQSAIAASQEELGDGWLNSFLTSPIWRFVLSPGVCGNKAVAGIVMPSVDKVGRYFPLTVAVTFEQFLQLPLVFTAGNVWFEQLEDVALAGLEGKLDLSAFDQLIQSIPVFSLPTTAGAMQQSSSEKKAFIISMGNLGRPCNASVELNATSLACLRPGYSLWCNMGAEPIQSVLFAYEGMPPIESFSKFLNGEMYYTNGHVNPEFVDKSSENHPNSMFTNVNSKSTDPENSDLSSNPANNILSLTETGWRSWAITHTGMCRKYNEDSFLNRPEARLWVVADGMGGHKAGDVASQLIVNMLKDLSPIKSLESYVKAVETSLQNSNTQLRQLAARDYGNQLVGSTVVSLICDSGRCAFLWAGDSRLYRLRDEKLQQLTRDHCEQDEQLTSSFSVKSSNVITRAVGADDILELDIERLDVLEGDVFLLCSDGLDKEMSLNEIEHFITNSEFQDIATNLVNEVLARGARDNVTVIVVAHT